MTLLSIGRRKSATLLGRVASSPFSTARKLPVLHKPKPSSDPNAAAPYTLQVLSWGKGACGQLGGGIEETRIYPVPIAEILVPSAASFALAPVAGRLPEGPAALPTAEGVVEIGVSSGLFHSSLIVDGKLWMWGKGKDGRLGLGHENSVSEPTLNPNVDSVRIVDMGALHSCMLNRQGQLFSWGYGGFGSLGHFLFKRELFPRFVDGSWRPKKIRHFATGATHTAAITEKGELYTWGRDEDQGRLGLGPDHTPDEDIGGLAVPTKVKALPVQPVAVSCGGYFTAVLTEDGKIWNFGLNSHHELGRDNDCWEPKPLTSLEDVRIVQISCGGFHSLALTDEGKVLSWGAGENGQLGHSSLESQKVPKEIEALSDKRVVYINSGGSSSAAITDDGELYMWGNARDSQLGVPGLPEVQPSPVLVNFLKEDDGLGPHKVEAVSVGACHTVCIVSRSSE